HSADRCRTPPPTTEISPLSLHDALPICQRAGEKAYAQPVPCGVGKTADGTQHAGAQVVREQIERGGFGANRSGTAADPTAGHRIDRKSTRLNSSHVKISYAVFCLKKKKR